MSPPEAAAGPDGSLNNPETGVGASGADAGRRPHLTIRTPRLYELGLPAVFVIVVVVGGLTNSTFLTGDNIRAILLSASITGIVAIGMTFMVLSGNFVSLGTQQSAMLASVIFISAVGHGWNSGLAIVTVIAAIIVLGLAQAIVVSLGLNPIITTLATGAIVFGLVASVTQSRIVGTGHYNVNWLSSQPLGLPLPIYVFGVIAVIAQLVSSRSTIGRRIVLVGANRATAVTTGISIRGTTIWAFVLFSIAIAIAGILEGAQLGLSSVNAFPTLTFDVIAGVLVGGTAIQGGEGSPLRTVVGVIIISMLTNIMILRNFSTGGRETAIGAILVGIVILLQLIRLRGGTR